MGNNPSTPNHPRATAPGHEPPRQPRRNTNPIAVTNQGVAAPPESSLAHAQGSTASQASSWKSPAEWASSGAASTIPSISSASRTRSDGLPEASKPVDVPVAPGGPSASTSASQSPSATRHRHHHHHHHHHHRGYEDEDEADREDDESLDAPSTSPPLPPSSTATTTNHAPASVGPLSSGSIQDMSYLATRPPRLPLPIEEEIHAPGSPILSPVGGKDILGEPLEEIGSDGRGVTAGQSVVAGARLADEDESDLAGTQSMLSAVTVSDEEDLDELRVDRTRPVVPTRIEWAHGGTKVYVTGTIFLWTRKTRLYPVEGRPGVFACTVNVVPGTHHIRFLVDGNMCTSPDLPTTVDFGNNLVNYIEVSADDLPENSAEGGAAGVAAAAAGGSLTAQEAQRRMSTAKLAGGGTAFTAPGAAKGPAQDKAQAEAEAPESAKAQPAARSRPVENLDKYSSKIPHYLADFDQPEDSPPYQFAISAIERLPPPPGLPGFLSKPILNLPILMKEDNSVLIMPNHTTLNHLATSSIKNNVLAVSATTRYRSKYVTTIIYKPTSEDS